MKAKEITTVDDLPYNLAEAERFLVERALAKSGGNVSQAAKLLGVNRIKIYRILARAGQKDE